MPAPLLLAPLTLSVGILLFGCARSPAPTPAVLPPGTPQRMASIAGFETPESVRYDPEQDVYFVSNIAGNPSARDGAGFISRVGPDGTIRELRFIESGRGGVTLHAPKGMALSGDTLWVADIDAVRAFDRRTGAPLAAMELQCAGATFLNDIAIGADGAKYVTDTGIVVDAQGQMSHPGANRIFRVHGSGAQTVAEGEALAMPNGIAADGAGGFLLAPVGGTAVQRWRPGEAAPQQLAEGPGGYDGLEVLPDGRVLVSSWADSAVYELRGTTLRPLIRGVNSPADLGVDSRRGRVAVPLFLENRVEIWALPEGGR